MKKLILFCLLGLFALGSCQDNMDELIGQKSEIENEIKSKYERLQFNDRNDIRAAIENDNFNIGTSTRSNGFISMLSACPGTRSAETGEEQTYYELLEFDRLVPNENLAKLLNPNGEVIVNDTIFCINPNGTYFFHKSMEPMFATAYEADSLGTLISDDLYAIADGIYRYETFKDTEYEEIEMEFGDDEYNIWEEDEDDIITSRAAPEPNYYLFPTFKQDRRGLFGKLWQGLFGHDKYHDVKLSSKRKVRGRVYAYAYVFYSEAGITGKMQKKNWIGWSDTQADELRVGWNKMIFKCNVDIPELNRLPKGEIKVGSVHDFEMPRLGKGKMVDLYMLDINSVDLWKVGTTLGKQAVAALNKNYGSGSKIKESDVKAYTVTTPKAIYLLIPEDMVKVYNRKNYTRVFNDSFHFNFVINFGNLPKDVWGWLKTVQSTLKSAKYKLHETDAIICGRLGNQWAGFKVVK